jgi:hypothetical protein
MSKALFAILMLAAVAMIASGIALAVIHEPAAEPAQPTATPTVTVPALSDGDVFDYRVTYGEEVTTYTKTVNGSAVIDNVDCYRIDVDMEPAAERVTIAGNSTVVSGDMWVSKDTLLSMRKMPVAQVQHPDYGQITAVTTLNYSYTISAGWPWRVGNTWAYVLDVKSSTGQQYVLNNDVTLIEWLADDVGLFVKMVDYGNYAEPETRELESYPGPQ